MIDASTKIYRFTEKEIKENSFLSAAYRSKIPSKIAEVFKQLRVKVRRSYSNSTMSLDIELPLNVELPFIGNKVPSKFNIISVENFMDTSKAYISGDHIHEDFGEIGVFSLQLENINSTLPRGSYVRDGYIENINHIPREVSINDYMGECIGIVEITITNIPYSIVKQLHSDISEELYPYYLHMLHGWNVICFHYVWNVGNNYLVNLNKIKEHIINSSQEY